MRQFEFTANSPSTALVIVFPVGVKGLFNPAIHGLVREVQEKLDDVYVTYALSTGESPTVPDAIAASKFNGCEAAVVVHQHESSDGSQVVAPDGDYAIRAEASAIELDSATVIGAFEQAVTSQGQAA
jgi:hypothetical protein